MGRVNFLLVLAGLASALYLVHVQYESRRLYVEMEKAQAQGRALETERQRLEVEKRAQATPLRVEKLAIDRLKRHPATPAITQYITSPDSRAQETPLEGTPAIPTRP